MHRGNVRGEQGRADDRPGDGPPAEEVGVPLVRLAAKAGPTTYRNDAHQIDQNDRRINPADAQMAVHAFRRWLAHEKMLRCI